MSAATDNVGLFFGEDIFIAIGSILLMIGFLEQNGISLAPLELSVWAIPTAIIAFLIHGARLLWMDNQLKAPRHPRETEGPAASDEKKRDPRVRGDDGSGELGAKPI